MGDVCDMIDGLLTIPELAHKNNVPESEVNCRMCSFCHLATINFDRKTCSCIHWSARVNLDSFCSKYTREYDKVG